jgi:hypothetical protein
MTRLVAVLGYSDCTTSELHTVCRARLDRAAEESGPEDVVLFSGWARSPDAQAEAELMAASFRGQARTCLVDRDSRTTLGNAIAMARAARRVGADEIVLVTSRWHARRAALLARTALRGSGATLRLAVADEPVHPATRAREAASWLVVPLLAVIAARTR